MRLSPAAQRARLTKARRQLAALEEVRDRPTNETKRAAIARVVTWAHRSSYRRWQLALDAEGFEGLIDWRIAPASPMPALVREVICTLRRVDSDTSASAIVAFVKEHHDFETSETKVKRVLKSAGLQRRPGNPSGVRGDAVGRLELAGMRLVEAAAVETGYLDALTTAIVEHVADLPRPGPDSVPDTSGRDECGRFLSGYNERYRKREGDDIGPGFASVATKREGMDPGRFQVGLVDDAIIARKLHAMLVSPLLGNGRWDGIRVPRGALLEELCGYGYMPATLEKFTGELKYAGVSSTLWEVHARLWLNQTKAWGTPRRAAVLYVDGTTKPVWTTLFSQCTKVSSVGRTMPGLEQVVFHSGYGVPLWQVTHSGRAPLVKQIPQMLKTMEESWGSSAVGRIVVIDSEANSVPFLKGLEQGEQGRGWVTRLRPGWVRSKRIFNRTNYRAYRNGDRVRVGVADFADPEVKGGKFRMRVVEVERRTTGKMTYLGASTKLDEREWKSHELADLYFDRWPNQEANFRAVNQATESKQVHGYGKQLVDNISVLTELDKLDGRLRGGLERLERQQSEEEELCRKLRDSKRELARKVRREATVRRNLDGRALSGSKVLVSTQRLMEEHLELSGEVSARTEAISRHKKKLQDAEGRVGRTTKKLEVWRQRQEVLQTRRRIFAHDVELDSLFSLLKVGLTLLVTFVLKEYLGDAKMDVVTFLDHMATLPASVRTTPQLEIVTFEYNRRDPEVMGLLENHCQAINDRELRLRSGRILRIDVEAPPKRGRPPPPGSRVGSGDRFSR